MIASRGSRYACVARIFRPPVPHRTPTPRGLAVSTPAVPASDRARLPPTSPESKWPEHPLAPEPRLRQSVPPAEAGRATLVSADTGLCPCHSLQSLTRSILPNGAILAASPQVGTPDCSCAMYSCTRLAFAGWCGVCHNTWPNRSMASSPCCRFPNVSELEIAISSGGVRRGRNQCSRIVKIRRSSARYSPSSRPVASPANSHRAGTLRISADAEQAAPSSARSVRRISPSTSLVWEFHKCWRS